ncbi:MAG: fumarylacetoacetase [Halieaceae bacterium]|jgi:fumarylacetoacetase|nr:fumarylacetoacetase [Halieaceae bacterium]
MTAYTLNETHDPARRSWVDSANDGKTDFPIQNLPYGIFRRRGGDDPWHAGVAIGDQILDLRCAAASGLIQGRAATALAACQGETLNPLMALDSRHWSALRATLSGWLVSGAEVQPQVSEWLVPMSQVEYALPAAIGDYTDFYTSIYHATNIGKLFRPDNPLLPNYHWVPIGYHGRSSSIAVSGQQFHRPQGQTKPADSDMPIFGPSQRLDYELEVGIFIGQGNSLGQPIPLDAAEQHVFGLCLLNDWSARDLQAWEYQPLGPFLAKNFASTVSPWVVTLEALAPYRLPWQRDAEAPQPLEYLESQANRASGAFDLQLEVLLQTQAMRSEGLPAERLSLTNFRHSYWSVGQLVTHHSVNGCNLRPGDLLGSGTQSGPHLSEAGALIELTQGGEQPVTLKNGEQRRFLQDGDRVILRGWCEGAVRIGFGEVSGEVLPVVVDHVTAS